MVCTLGHVAESETGPVNDEEFIMEKCSAVEYTAPNGATLTLTQAAPGWNLTNSETGKVTHTSGMGEMIGHIRQTYGWPLPSKSID